MSLIGRPRKGFNVQAYNAQKFKRERAEGPHSPPPNANSTAPASGWASRDHGGFHRKAGGFDLIVTDQTDRGAGWCWHVLLDGDFGDVISGSRAGTAEEAQQAAENFASHFCERTISALQAIRLTTSPAERLNISSAAESIATALHHAGKDRTLTKINMDSIVGAVVGYLAAGLQRLSKYDTEALIEVALRKTVEKVG